MYGKMQEPGLTEIIPFTYISAILGPVSCIFHILSFLEGLILKLKLHTLATWCEERTHSKRPWCWERLKAGGEGDDRRWNGWIASQNRWTWVWASSGSWWWTGKPGVLQSIGSQRARHEWAAELNWASLGLTVGSGYSLMAGSSGIVLLPEYP